MAPLKALCHAAGSLFSPHRKEHTNQEIDLEMKLHDREREAKKRSTISAPPQLSFALEGLKSNKLVYFYTNPPIARRRRRIYCHSIVGTDRAMIVPVSLGNSQLCDTWRIKLAL